MWIPHLWWSWGPSVIRNSTIVKQLCFEKKSIVGWKGVDLVILCVVNRWALFILFIYLWGWHDLFFFELGWHDLSHIEFGPYYLVLNQISGNSCKTSPMYGMSPICEMSYYVKNKKKLNRTKRQKKNLDPKLSQRTIQWCFDA
jgi:hypothetical protein